MPERKYTSLPANKSAIQFFFIVTISIFAFFTSCSKRTVWNTEKTVFQEQLASNHSELLKSIDFSIIKLEEIRTLGPGAAYYMAQLLMDLEINEPFVPLLLVEWRKGSGVWKKEAAISLIDHYISRKDYSEAERFGEKVLEEYPDDPAILRRYVESLYWQKKNAPALKGIQKLKGLSDSDLAESNADFAADPALNEIELFEAVASARLGVGAWPDLITALFINQKRSRIHVRAFDFLQIENRLHFFSDEARKLMEGTALLERGSFDEALILLVPFLEGGGSPFLSRHVIANIEYAYSRTGKFVEGAEVFRRAAGVLASANRSSLSVDATVSSGILYRKGGRFRDAIARFAAAFEASKEQIASPRAQRILWYLFDTRAKSSVELGLSFIPDVFAHWSNPGYFSDALDSLITALVSRRNWKAIAGLLPAFPPETEPEVRARVAYICASAIKLGWMAPPSSFQDAFNPREDIAETAQTARKSEAVRTMEMTPTSKERLARALFEQAIESSENGYYSLMASLAMDRRYEPFAVPETGDSEEVSIPEILTPKEQFVLGFLPFHLPRLAYSKASTGPEALSENVLLKVARSLIGSRDYISALRIMDMLHSRPDFELTAERGQLKFPKAFPELIEAAARNEGIPAYFLYAMVRTESYFSPEISSHAGAVGLSQLMPATAAEVSGKMGLEKPDLQDPATNIAIGTRYLSELVSRFGNLLFGLFAYNAGPGRMSRWMSLFDDLPADMMLEALPFAETRNHGRRVLQSAVAYGALYGNMPPAEVVGRIFPER